MLLQRADKLPPFLCRLIARKRVTVGRRAYWMPMSHADIAEASELPRSTVADISPRTTWRGVPIETVDAFASACGVDLTQPGRHIRWLRKHRTRHIADGNAQQRRFFARLLTAKAPEPTRS